MALMTPARPADDIGEILVTAEQIASTVAQLGRRIAADYQSKDLAQPIEGRDVLVVEDILDTGHTLSYVLEHLRGQRPASLRLCVLLDKPARRIIPVEIDYRGFEIPDKFVVGYGLDYAERYRN